MAGRACIFTISGTLGHLLRKLTSVQGTLWRRMGQDSSRAALVYQQASRKVDEAIADKLSALIEGVGSKVKHSDGKEDDGTSGVLLPAG